MKNHTLELAKKSGFVTWGDEDWGPGVEAVDWSSEYDTELEYFKNLIVRECAWIIQEFVDQRVPASEYSKKLVNHWQKLA